MFATERLVERPPRLFRALFPGDLFRVPPEKRSRGGELLPVFLTFDDGPIPEITPKVLDILDEFDVKATFFMVGQNVERNPDLLAEVRGRGHSVGNHTHRHLQGIKVSLREYLDDVAEADALIGSPLFRPPHGWLRRSQAQALRKNHRVVMYDLVTRDYNASLSPDRVVRNVTELAREGSIVVFHDSIKSWPRLCEALPRSIEWLLSNGYIPLPMTESMDFGKAR